MENFGNPVDGIGADLGQGSNLANTSTLGQQPGDIPAPFDHPQLGGGQQVLEKLAPGQAILTQDLAGFVKEINVISILRRGWLCFGLGH